MLSRLRIFFGKPSRPQHAPQQYSVTRRCNGMLKSSAEAMAFSTNSAPNTDFRIARPRSNNSSFIAEISFVCSVQVMNVPKNRERSSLLRCRPDRRGERRFGRIDGLRLAVLPLHDEEFRIDAPAVLVETNARAGEESGRAVGVVHGGNRSGEGVEMGGAG